tara:strand:- start:3593 stop:4549 length:957 start_codon:yes stop_codon:yes gene_type:complete
VILPSAGTDHLNASSLPLVRLRLAKLASHLVVALIALVVIGGATRVMEAGLACPDWPLCYGSLLPGRQMNVQVFLEWFHRLDAFLVGIAFLLQFLIALFFRSKLPQWLIWVYASGLFLVVIQGLLGGVTVLGLLPSTVVTAHLALALTLVALMSAVSQRLLQVRSSPAPKWWLWLGGSSLGVVIFQCLLGGRMATTWSSKRCLVQGENCQLLDFHMISAMPVCLLILIFVGTSVVSGGWPRSQWPLLSLAFLLVIFQIALGITSVHLGLSEPLITVAHQLIAAILVASLAALSFRRPNDSRSIISDQFDESLLEACHG